MILLGSLALWVCPAPQVTWRPPQVEASTLAADDKVVPWFAGDYPALLAKARGTESLVFLDFWAPWCDWCRRLENESLSDQRVVDVLSGMLCYSVDTSSESGAALFKEFNEPDLPALIFLESDGAIRDVLMGFHGPDELLREVDRIVRDDGTLSELRRLVAATPSDVYLRYQLATKLECIGDKAGYKAEIDAIRSLDPEARTVPMRSIRLDEIVGDLQKDLVLSPLYEFLAEEQDESLLFHGWYAAWRFEDYLCRKAGWDGDPEAEKAHAGLWIEASRKVWQHTPEERYASLGNAIAWMLYENRSRLSDADKAFALKVARAAVDAASAEAAVIDTLACCLHMNGREGEALANVKLCIELEPQNRTWRERYEEFTR